MTRTTALVRMVRRGWWWLRDYAYVLGRQVGAALRRGGARELAVGRADLRPVLLLPGVYEPWTFLRPLADVLHAAGHAVHVLPGLGYNHRPIPETARAVGAYLTEHDLRDVVVVAHSKGGLVGKRVMLSEDPDGRVRAMVTVNTPFAGSVYARLVPVRAVRAFVPTDATLVALAAERTVDARITSVGSVFDPHVPAGSVLDGAVNLTLPTPGHFRVLTDPDLPRVVLAVLRGKVPQGA